MIPVALLERAHRATASRDPAERAHAYRLLRQAAAELANARLRLAANVIENAHGNQVFPEAVVVRDEPPPPRKGRFWLGRLG